MKSLHEMSLGLLMMHGHLSVEAVRQQREEEEAKAEASRAMVKSAPKVAVCPPKLATCC